jgi:hypothetical protein
MGKSIKAFAVRLKKSGGQEAELLWNATNLVA